MTPCKLLIGTKDTETAEKWRRMLQDKNIADADIDNSLVRLSQDLKNTIYDVALIDADLLEPEGTRRLSLLQERHGITRFVIFTTHHNPHDEITAILHGAKGYILKNICDETLANVIKHVMMGEIWVDRLFISRLLIELADLIKVNLDEYDLHEFDKQLEKLTPREREIAQLISTGASNPRIAQILQIKDRTVKAHLSEIFRKLSVADRLQLAIYMNQHFRVLNKIAPPSDRP